MTSNSRGDKVLYVRVPLDRKLALDAIARAEKQSASKVMNRLIDYLVESTTAQRQAIIGGRTAEEGAVNTISHLMMRLSWADHAFNHRRWSWACEEYMDLARMSKESNAPGTWQFAQYKLGYCWLEMGIALQSKAIECRDESGLTHEVKEMFDAAEWAMRASIAFNRRYYKYEGQRARAAAHHAVVQYNTACTWALLAKARIERASETQNIQQRQSEVEERGGELWPTRPLPEEWEQNVDGGKWNGLVDETLRCLADLARGNEEGWDAGPPGAFLCELAKSDPDLDFIRNSDSLRERFTEAIATHGHADLVAEFRRSRGVVERYVVEDMPDIEAMLRRVQ